MGNPSDLAYELKTGLSKESVVSIRRNVSVSRDELTFRGRLERDPGRRHLEGGGKEGGRKRGGRQPGSFFTPFAT